MTNLRLLIGAVMVAAALIVIGALVHDTRSAGLVWSLSAVPIATLLYSVRRKNRLVYGLVEMAAAIAALFFLFLRFDPGELTVESVAGRTVAILAVVYVMVRSLDNIGEGLQPDSSMENYWIRLFPKTK